MSETPLTDNATWIADSIHSVDGFPVVDAAFAKALELDAAWLRRQLATVRRDTLKEVIQYVDRLELAYAAADTTISAEKALGLLSRDLAAMTPHATTIEGGRE